MNRHRSQLTVLAIAMGCCTVLLTGRAGPSLADSPVSHSTLSTAPRNLASDQVALRAYRRYLRGLVSDIPAWRRADDSFIASITTTCPNALAAINALPVSSINQSTLSAFGEELVADLAVMSSMPDRAPLVSMAKTLSSLRWSDHKTGLKIQRYISTTRTVSALAPSDLCADAQALAASDTQTTPPGTLQWVATYGRDANRAAAANAAFIKTLTRFESPADMPVAAAINRLGARLRSAIKAVFTAEAPKLLSALGIAG